MKIVTELAADSDAPLPSVITQQTEVFIDKILLGKLTSAEIAKVKDILERWLQSYVNVKPSTSWFVIGSILDLRTDSI